MCCEDSCYYELNLSLHVTVIEKQLLTAKSLHETICGGTF